MSHHDIFQHELTFTCNKNVDFCNAEDRLQSCALLYNTESFKSWMNKSKGNISVNIKPQTDSWIWILRVLCLCEWTAQTRGFVYYTYVCVLSAISLYEDINTWMYLLSCSESHFRSILPFLLRKTILISHTHRIWRSLRQAVKRKVRFGLKRLWQNVHLNVVTIIIITIFIPCFIFYSMFD